MGLRKFTPKTSQQIKIGKRKCICILNCAAKIIRVNVFIRLKIANLRIKNRSEKSVYCISKKWAKNLNSFMKMCQNYAATRLPNPTPSLRWRREGEVGFTQCSDQPTRVYSRLDTCHNFA